MANNQSRASVVFTFYRTEACSPLVQRVVGLLQQDVGGILYRKRVRGVPSVAREAAWLLENCKTQEGILSGLQECDIWLEVQTKSSSPAPMEVLSTVVNELVERAKDFSLRLDWR